MTGLYRGVNNVDLEPTEFSIGQNYPNPFSERTTIKYCVAYKTRVQITVFDHYGNLVEELVNDERLPGTYAIEFKTTTNQFGENRKLDQGYYSYRMKAGDFSSEIKWLCINKLSGRVNMKSFLQTLFFFLLVTQICFGQWYQQNSGTNKNLHAVQFTDANNGFVVGDSGTILRTTDAGNNWEIQTNETNLPLNDIFFLDENNGWIAGGYANTGQVFWTKEIIFKTTDGGASWYKQFEDSIDSPSSIFFNDILNGWCVGYKIRKTTDGGINWSEVIGMGWEVWSDLYFKNLDTGIVVGTTFLEGRGSYGSFLSTKDGGTNWGWQQFIEGFGGLGGVCFSSPNSVYAVGGVVAFFNHFSYGIKAKTTDWGTTWAIDTIPGPAFSDVYFTDETNGWIVGANRILNTSDGGVTWTIQMSDTLNVFSSVFFSDISNGWAVGDRGAIFRTTNGGVSFIEEEKIDEVPAEFLLAQNYPNPFNPSTTFRYSIPTQSKVVIKVFDILGKEIATLMDEEKSVGTYELTWNAASLSSGIYFYQLQAVEFMQTRKMILLK